MIIIMYSNNDNNNNNNYDYLTDGIYINKRLRLKYVFLPLSQPEHFVAKPTNREQVNMPRDQSGRVPISNSSRVNTSCAAAPPPVRLGEPNERVQPPPPYASDR